MYNLSVNVIIIEIYRTRHSVIEIKLVRFKVHPNITSCPVSI